LGFAIGMNRRLEQAVDPFIWFLYSAPSVALYPVLVVWFGFGFATVVAITFLLTFVSITVNTLTGVRSVDQQLVRAVLAFGGRRRHVIGKVILPATVAYVLAGIRIGLGRALTGVTLGEMFGSQAGLGFRITFYASHLQTADVFVPLTVLVVSGLLLYRISDIIETRLLAWRRA
jgi:NitT/TauT family transport system permease protein